MPSLCCVSRRGGCLDLVRFRIKHIFLRFHPLSFLALAVLKTSRLGGSLNGESCSSNLLAHRIRILATRTNEPAPEIAIDYWRLPADAKLLDVMYAVRSDETTHRFVNHSLANLNPATDVNPFALREPDMHVKGKKIE